MPKSTAETLKEIQKRLSISIVNTDSPKPFCNETGAKEPRVKQIAVGSDSLSNSSWSATASENKPIVSQVRQISIETRPSTTQPSLSSNLTTQAGTLNKSSTVSSSSDIKLQSSVKLNNLNLAENKSQFPGTNRVQVDKTTPNVTRAVQNSSFSESKQNPSNRNALNISEIKMPHRNNASEIKTQILHTRTQNQTVPPDVKANSNQGRLSSPPIEGKTNSNPGRQLNTSNSTSVLDKSIGQRNQMLVKEINTPVRPSDLKTLSTPKVQHNFKVISTPRVISQYQPNTARVSGINNNGKITVSKTSVNAEHSLHSPFRVASTLAKSVSDEKSVNYVSKFTQNAVSSESQSNSIYLPLKSETQADNAAAKLTKLPLELSHKSVHFENSETISPIVNTMPRVATKRLAVATSTPVSASKRKFVKIESSTSELSGIQSDVNTLSSDESPVKEKKIIKMRTLAPSLTITPVNSTATPSSSTNSIKVAVAADPNQKIVFLCPMCNQCSYNLTSCASCHHIFSSTPKHYVKSTKSGSIITNTEKEEGKKETTKKIVFTQTIEKSTKIVCEFTQLPSQELLSSPRRGRPKRKIPEPVLVQLSSDEEETYQPMTDHIMYPDENNDEEHSSNSDMMQEENPEFEDQEFPGVTRINHQLVPQHVMNNSLEEEEEDPEDEEMEHEMDSEEELMQGDLGMEQPEFDEEDEELEEEEEEIAPDEEEKFNNSYFNKSNTLISKIVLKCRSIRIGSYKIHPDQQSNSIDVTVTDKGIHFLAPMISGKSIVKLTLLSSDTESTWIHFGKCLPIIFVKTTENFGNYIRRSLNMTKAHAELFLPRSEDPKKNKLTFLIDGLIDDQRMFMRQIFPGPEKLKEIDQKEANEILVKSTPNTNMVKLNPQDLMSSTISSPVLQVSAQGVIPSGLSTQALSITKVTVRSEPPAPVKKLLTYPPPPQTGGIAINTADLATLEEGEFLNDAILDFYLKYVFYEKLTPEDREKTHIFSSFFYPRLTQKPDRLRPGEDAPKTMQVRRHNQVKTWTKHVDIFSKDYIIIPVNQHNHWFLAFICYPGHIPDTPIEKLEPKPFLSTDSLNSSSDNTTNKVIIEEECINNEDVPSPNNSSINDASYEVEEPPDSDEDDSTELPGKRNNCNVTYYDRSQRKETPCILIFDSLSGPNRWRIAATLREYLEIEWKIRKGTKKIFDRNTMQGFIVKCPQQTNFSDCGLYVLQYVESFFEKPIPYFHNPMPDLTDWFEDAKISKKRQEIKKLILNLQRKYQIKLQTPVSGVTIKKINQPASSPTVTSTQPDNR